MSARRFVPVLVLAAGWLTLVATSRTLDEHLEAGLAPDAEMASLRSFGLELTFEGDEARAWGAIPSLTFVFDETRVVPCSVAEDSRERRAFPLELPIRVPYCVLQTGCDHGAEQRWGELEWLRDDGRIVEGLFSVGSDVVANAPVRAYGSIDYGRSDNTPLPPGERRLRIVPTR